jgi:hypothetical protein
LEHPYIATDAGQTAKAGSGKRQVRKADDYVGGVVPSLHYIKEDILKCQEFLERLYSM